jgi:hypothetical protein
MSDACNADRQELVRRARGGRKSRTSVFSKAAPTKWHPTALRNPSDGEPFTEDNCWAFVADAIEAGAPVEEIVLRLPAGKRGFVLKLRGHGGVAIYVKLQLLADKVLGRSFHESMGQTDEDEDE